MSAASDQRTSETNEKGNGPKGGFRRRRVVVGAALGLVLVGAPVFLMVGGCGPKNDSSWSGGQGPAGYPGPVINVIAAENQYGSLVSQLGGQGVRVKSILTNPDTDPHEFQSNAQVHIDYQAAQLVVENGLGYDDWSDKILDSLSSKPKVVNAGAVLGLKVGDNPHRWYSPDDVDKICNAITAALKEANPAGAAYFDARAKDCAEKLKPYHEAVEDIRKQFPGVPVGATESIFVPMAKATGLDLISPPGLMNAVSEDAPVKADDKDLFEKQIKEKKIKVLVYNNQTNSAVTSELKDLTEKAGIPIVGVSETLTPPDATFQDWQISQLKALRDALAH